MQLKFSIKPRGPFKWWHVVYQLYKLEPILWTIKKFYEQFKELTLQSKHISIRISIFEWLKFPIL